MEELIELKIAEAQEILRCLGLPDQQQNRLSALTLLALASVKPNDKWQDATKNSLTLSKDIMLFVNREYHADYKPNTRESFRKIALRPFLENNIILLNPDDPNLSPSSSKTHYALTDLVLETITKFQTEDWNNGIQNFKKNQFPENTATNPRLTKITINNYKSILSDTIELGRFNVFIGANGCGKSNILEALAMLGASYADDATFEGLYSRGVRIARPDLVLSSFLNTQQRPNIEMEVHFKDLDVKTFSTSLFPENPNDIYTHWSNRNEYVDEKMRARIKELAREIVDQEVQKSKEAADGGAKGIDLNPIIKNITDKVLEENPIELMSEKTTKLLKDYSIYDLNTRSLRGITPADSRKTPLGINGEGLDLLISNFNSYERDYLNECNSFFDWLDEILSDRDDKNKLEGLKAGRSTSTLYFTDRFMQKQNNTLSAENSNEGILHVLFYLALFISNKTPDLFAIDNIETALNPRLCKALIALLVELSKKRGKQVLITTHNPAILDGLNLFDDEQRLFEVYRNDEGHTKTRRIQFKLNLEDKEDNLSEMWIEGLLGGIPKNFF